MEDIFDQLQEAQKPIITKTKRSKLIIKVIATALTIIVVASGAFVGGYFVGAGEGTKVSEKEYEIIGQYQVLDSLIDFINKNYYLDVSTEQHLLNACAGIAGLLDDYSGIMGDDTIEYRSTYIGITVNSAVPGRFRISWIDEGSPAYYATEDISIGDYIVAVKVGDSPSVTVEGRYIEVLTSLITNHQAGQKITLTLAKNYNESTKSYENLFHTEIEVNYRYSTTYVHYIGDFSIVDPDFVISNDIGYISLSYFNDESVYQFAEAIDNFVQDGKKYLILDLRNNPGGAGTSLREIASYLITDETDSDNVEIITHEFKDGTKYVYRNEENRYIYKNLEREYRPKIAVLVNEGSASSSEALLGSMIVAGTCEVFGTNTYGKGIGQSQYDFRINDVFDFTLSLSSGYYYFSDDVSEYINEAAEPVYNIHGVGFMPKTEYYVEQNVYTILSKDAQFLKAVEYFG